MDAPTGKTKMLALDTEPAKQLSYYKAAEGFGVLAPRGWYCFGTYGSGGDTLYVSPEPINTPDLLSTHWAGFAGPVVELARRYGDTSGRWEVASIIARVFPAHRAFVSGVIKDFFEPPGKFHFGPYPHDRLIYRSADAVEYETPAQTDGLGTNSQLRKDASPISGVAILVGPAPDSLLLSARIPPNLTQLTSAIIRQVESDALHTHPEGP